MQVEPNVVRFADTVNVYVLRHDDEAILIDFGSGDVLDALDALGVTRVTDVLLTGGPGAGITVEIRNPATVSGRPATIPGCGVGLAGLAERTSLAGGRLEHGFSPVGDFHLRGWLPWPA